MTQCIIQSNTNKKCEEIDQTNVQSNPTNLSIVSTAFIRMKMKRNLALANYCETVNV